MSNYGGNGALTKVDHIRKSLLKDIYSPIRVRKSSDVRIVLNSYERGGNLKNEKSRSYSAVFHATKAFKKLQPEISKQKPREIRKVIDARLCDAGFGGRILKRLFIHSEQSVKDSNREQMLNAVKSLRIMGFELRNTI